MTGSATNETNESLRFARLRYHTESTEIHKKAGKYHTESTEIYRKVGNYLTEPEYFHRIGWADTKI